MNGIIRFDKDKITVLYLMGFILSYTWISIWIFFIMSLYPSNMSPARGVVDNPYKVAQFQQFFQNFFPFLKRKKTLSKLQSFQLFTMELRICFQNFTSLIFNEQMMNFLFIFFLFISTTLPEFLFSTDTNETWKKTESKEEKHFHTCLCG